MATETTVRTKLVDADGHYYEPPTAIAEYIDPEYRDIAPKRVIGPDGHERIEGKHWGSFNVGGGGAPQFRRAGGVGDGLVGVDRNDGVDIMDRTDRDRHGHEDPAARLKVMDEEGIDVAVLYPSGALTWIPEPEYHHVLSRALNRWLADYASAAPGRLYGAANIVAIHDVEAACDEVRRCVKEHGFKAVFLRTCTAKENDRWWGRQYDPFWATCQELDVAVGFHPFNGDTMFGAPSYFDLWGPGADKLFMRTPFASVVDAMASVMGVIIGGVAERYPDLRFTILESSGGCWSRFWSVWTSGSRPLGTHFLSSSSSPATISDARVGSRSTPRRPRSSSPPNGWARTGSSGAPTTPTPTPFTPGS